jgi:DNA-binding transcriptional LysR family regulator
VFDPVTLDQLRALVAVVEEGSFSAAARKLRRVQSAISTAMANLELQLGVTLFDRTTKIATLTDQGEAVVAAARRVLAEVDALRRLTTGMAGGLEPSVSLCVDALFPLSALVELCSGFAERFPAVNLRVDTEVMSTVSARVLEGRATLGVTGPYGIVPGLERRVLAKIHMVPVAGRDHPLARVRGPLPAAAMNDAVQIVLSERGDSGAADQGVLSLRTWRVADLQTKLALIRKNLGWGNLPAHLIEGDLARGDLVRVHPAAWADDEHVLVLSAVYRTGLAFGPAHRWVLEQLQTLCAAASPAPPPRRRAKR